MADCGFDPVCWAGEQVAKTVSPLIWQQLEDWMARGAATAVRLSVSGWLNVPSPDVTTANGGVAYLSAYTRTITYVVFAVALMVQAAHLAWSQRGEDVREMGRSILQFVVVSGGGVAAVALLTEAGNEYSTWILNASTSGTTGATMGDRIITLLGITSPAGEIVALPVNGPVVALLCFLVSLAGIIQVLLIYARAIVLVLLSGMLPLAAAAAMTRRGRSILDRYMAWMLAWLLYKPVAASIYAGAFFMMGTGGALSFIAGLGAIVMAVFALPALMRLINPMVAGVGGGNAGIAAAASLAGPIAEGAVTLASGVGSSNASDPTSGQGGVHDATYGSRPSGSVPGGGSSGPGGGGSPAGLPGTTAGSGQASSGAASAGASSTSAAGAASGAAAGPWGLVAEQATIAAKGASTAPAHGTRQVANDASGMGGGQP